MTISLSISKSKTLFLWTALLAAFAVAMYAAQRDVLSDTANYYGFYRDLREGGLTSVFSCKAFEPLFCVGSYAFSTLTGSDAAVQFVWSFLFYGVTLRAFLEFWPQFVSSSRYSVISLVTFLFVAANYIDPQIIYFLTRQYVAAAFLMLGTARCLNRKSPFLPFALAGLIHFGSLPIAALLFLATRERIGWKLVLTVLGGLLFFIYYLSSFVLFDAYLDSLRFRVELYANKNDGNVTVVQEIRLLIYWAAATYLFTIAKSRLALAYVIVYAAYLFTFQNDLYHLRYHKYLEVMCWPSAFILFYIHREAAGHLVVGALSYRIYKYASLFSPEAGAPSMARTLLLSFLTLVSWLSL